MNSKPQDEIKITVPARYIAALKLFAAYSGHRNYPKGINLEIGRYESRLVATNGVILGCFRVIGDQPDVTEPLRDIIIPNELVRPIRSYGHVEITIGPIDTNQNDDGDAATVSRARPITLAYGWRKMKGKTLDGGFPDYRRVIPSKVSGDPAQFNPYDVGTLSKAYIALHGARKQPLFCIGFNGTKAALIDLDDPNFVGVISPIKPVSLTMPSTPPEWVADRLSVDIDSAPNHERRSA